MSFFQNIKIVVSYQLDLQNSTHKQPFRQKDASLPLSFVLTQPVLFCTYNNTRFFPFLSHCVRIYGH